MNDNRLLVAGAGLAGCEAAWAAANAGIDVTLIEMKPEKRTPAHHGDGFAELICSNSLKAARLDSAAGLLKEELRRLGSVCMEAADGCAVPAGGALAVDRDRFSARVTERIHHHPRITVEHRDLTDLPDSGAAVIATGPLTADTLAARLRTFCGGALSFYDAAAPIVAADSVDMDSAFPASRYGRDGGPPSYGRDGGVPEGESAGADRPSGDYPNCPLNKEEYEAFHAALVETETAPLHEFDAPADGVLRVYEGCMPIEVLAKRGKDAIRFGPMKPVGLRDPRTGHRPWAVLQLRRENAQGTMFNLVGFQTNLKFGEQKRVFGMIPALKNAEFLRYGVMHRNTFLDSPRLLNAGFGFRARPGLFFAGQMTGVEGHRVIIHKKSEAASNHAGSRISIIARNIVVLPERRRDLDSIALKKKFLLIFEECILFIFVHGFMCLNLSEWKATSTIIMQGAFASFVVAKVLLRLEKSWKIKKALD